MNQIELCVKLHYLLAKNRNNYNPEMGTFVKLPEGSTVRDLISSLQLPFEETRLIISIRDVMRMADFKLMDGDAVSIYPLISGG